MSIVHTERSMLGDIVTMIEFTIANACFTYPSNLHYPVVDMCCIIKLNYVHFPVAPSQVPCRVSGGLRCATRM